ncbi:MAG: hypothetical protein ACKOCN_11505 [Planctomycetaceae bacterium]
MLAVANTPGGGEGDQSPTSDRSMVAPATGGQRGSRSTSGSAVTSGESLVIASSAAGVGAGPSASTTAIAERSERDDGMRTGGGENRTVATPGVPGRATPSVGSGVSGSPRAQVDTTGVAAAAGAAGGGSGENGGAAASPMSIGRAADRRRNGAGAARDSTAAIGRASGLPKGDPGGAGDDDGLSVVGTDVSGIRSLLAARAAGGFARSSGDGAGRSATGAGDRIEESSGSNGKGSPGPLERVAAAAGAVDGRVRNVAEAFVGRRRRREPLAGEAAQSKADAMVERGLAFLARSQEPDGRWRLGQFAGSSADDTSTLESDSAATGLALLAFLGAGHDHFDGPHHETVRRGLDFLLTSQRADGDLYITAADDVSNGSAWLYSHAIATMAICEAYGMTGDPTVRLAAEQACRFVATAQHPSRGGWRYQPRVDSDLSVSAWMLVAMRSGQLSRLPIEPEVLTGVRALLDASATGSQAAPYHYNVLDPSQRTRPLSVLTMIAVATLMRLHTGTPVDDVGVQEAARLLEAQIPAYRGSGSSERDCYLWYYASQVLVHTGGSGWTNWYRGLIDALEPNQKTTGPKAGSWDAGGPEPDRWGRYAGRVYVTALHLLALEVPYRYLPTYTAGASNASE